MGNAAIIKYPFALLLLTVSFRASTQSITDSLINRVENGLSTQAVLPAGSAIAAKNIYDGLNLYKVAGVSIAVINNYEMEWSKTYGVADNSKGDPLTAATLFQCASIGKVITAMAVLRLVREGRIGLDEDVNNKLKSWKIEENNFTVKEKVTLRRLLSHSAGLFDDYGFEGYRPTDKIPSLLQILNNEPPANNKKKLKVEAVPGTTERYSGGGYVIIQQLIEDVTHQPFSSYVSETVFAPLGMSNTAYDFFPDRNSHKPIARGHDENGKIDKGRSYNVYPEMAAAGPWTTAADLAKLVIEIQKEQAGLSDAILDKALCKEMLTPQLNFKGLGVHLTGVGKPEAFWHAGNTAGFVGLFYGTTVKGQGAVVLTNSDKGEKLALQIMTGIADAYHWPVLKTYLYKEVSKEEISSYTGRYQAANGTIITIVDNRSGLLLTTVSPKKELPLYKISDTEFTLKASPDFVRVYFNSESGRVTGMTIAQNLGRVDNFKKVE